MNSLIVFTICFSVASSFAANPVHIEFENKKIWRGQIGQIVSVEFKNRGKKSTAEGVLSRATQDYIVVESELIFIDQILAMLPEPDQEPDPEPDREPDPEPDPESGSELFIPGTFSDTETPKKLDVVEKEKIAVVPLRGQVGWIYGQDYMNEPFFSVRILEEFFQKAKRSGVSKLILEIDSPGGYVYMRDPICNLIQDYRDDLEIIAFVRNSFSAASTMAMTCDRIFVFPNSSIGAAVVIGSDGTAAEEKIQAADASTVRGYYANANRSGSLADAMSLIDKELWFNKDTKKFSSEPSGPSQIWEQIVDNTEILSFDCNQAVKYGIAERQCNSIQEIFSTSKYLILDWSSKMNTQMKLANRDVERIAEKMYDTFNVNGIRTLVQQHNEINELVWYGDGSSAVKSKINKLKTKLRKQYYDLNKNAKSILEDRGKGKYSFDFDFTVLDLLSACVYTCERILELDFRKRFDAVTELYNQLADDLNAINGYSPE